MTGSIDSGFPRAHLLVLIAVICLTGCNTLDKRPSISLDDVIQMTKAGRTPSEIMAKLDQNPVYLHFSGSQFAALKQQGVADEVLDYLLMAYGNRIRSMARLEAEPVWWSNAWYHHPRVIFVRH